MSSFFKKDLLVFWRDRKEILLAVFLPIILIVILNTAFSGLFSSDSEPVYIDLGVVLEDDETAGLEQFENKVESLEIAPDEKQRIVEHAMQIGVNQQFVGFFKNPELSEWVTVQEVTEQEARKLVEMEELDAYIKIPNGFTDTVLSSSLLGIESEIGVTIHAKEQSTELSTIEDVVRQFINTVNMQFALGQTGDLDQAAQPVLPQGGKELVDDVDSYTFPQYFTIGISTLCALFIAQTIAVKTITEKRERVFNRIILSNSRPFHYLMGKVLSTFCLAWIQMMMTYVIIQLMLDVFPHKTASFWIGLFLMISLFSLAVAGLSGLFTSIALNMKDTNSAAGIFTMIVMTLGALGGSFFPLQGLPGFVQMIGEWTPNGVTQTALIQFIQYERLQDLVIPLGLLLGFFALCLVIALFMFPRRGRI